MKIIRKIWHWAILLCMLPAYGVMWIFYGIGIALRDFRDFAKDSVKKMIAPEHLPFTGLRGFYELKNSRQKAFEAEAENDSEKANEYWKICAYYFDTDAMLRVGDYYKSDYDIEDGRKLASEWYAAAASFGNKEGEDRYSYITGVELDEKEKSWMRRSFIKVRRVICLKNFPAD